LNAKLHLVIVIIITITLIVLISKCAYQKLLLKRSSHNEFDVELTSINNEEKQLFTSSPNQTRYKHVEEIKNLIKKY
jgi:hypothetical protein